MIVKMGKGMGDGRKAGAGLRKNYQITFLEVVFAYIAYPDSKRRPWRQEAAS